MSTWIKQQAIGALKSLKPNEADKVRAYIYELETRGGRLVTVLRSSLGMQNPVVGKIVNDAINNWDDCKPGEYDLAETESHVLETIMEWSEDFGSVIEKTHHREFLHAFETFVSGVELEYKRRNSADKVGREIELRREDGRGKLSVVSDASE